MVRWDVVLISDVTEQDVLLLPEYFPWAWATRARGKARSSSFNAAASSWFIGDAKSRKSNGMVKQLAKTGLRQAFGAWHHLVANNWNNNRYARRSSARRLEIGPGWSRLEGFETLNITWSRHTDYVCDASRRLPFNSNTFELIYASHILEHLPWYNVGCVLKEWHRVLRPGGTLEVWVPNGLEICRAFVMAEEGQLDPLDLDSWCKFNEQRDAARWANGRIFSYGDGLGTYGHPNWHLSIFSERYLRQCFAETGFVCHRTLTAGEVRGYDHGWINLGVSGRKL